MPDNTQGQGGMASWLKGQASGGLPQMTIGGDSKLGQMFMSKLQSNPGMLNGYIDQMFGNMPMHPAYSAMQSPQPGIGIPFPGRPAGIGQQPSPQTQAQPQMPWNGYTPHPALQSFLAQYRQPNMQSWFGQRQ